MEKLIELAKITASKSKGIGSNKNYRVGAVLFEASGKVLSARENTYKTHPFALKYSEYPYLHAETHCIVAAGLDNCPGCGIIVCRLRRDGSISMAKPCVSCVSAMKFAGISKIYYSDWDGKFQCEGL